MGSKEVCHSQSRQEYGSVLPSAKDSNNAQPSSPVCESYGQRLLAHVQLLAALCVASYTGVAARIYLSLLAESDGLPEFSSLYAQLLGTAILGVLSAHKVELQKNHKIFYTTLATGLCGSLTTFSSWNAEAAFSLLQVNRSSLTLLHSPDNVSRVVTFLTILLLGLASPIAALHLGKNVGAYVPLNHACTRVVCKCSSPASAVAVLFVWILCTAAVVGACLALNNMEVLFSLTLGCGGTYVRWWLSSFDTSRMNGFPLGTLAANVSGTWLIGLALAVMGYSIRGSVDDIVLSLLTGVVTGLCGCLTTVSTFVGQLNTLPFHLACLYALVSIATAQIGLLPVLVAYLYTTSNTV